MIALVLRAAVALLMVGSAAVPADAQTPAPVRTGPASFRVLMKGMPLGTVESSVESTDAGWIVRGSGMIDAPIGIVARRLDVAYTTDWKPLTASVELANGEERVLLHLAVASTARSRVEIVRAGQVVFLLADVSADALILPNLVFSAYEALAARLASAAAGTEMRAYVLPQREIVIRVDRVADARLPTAGGRLALRRWRVTFVTPDGPVAADVWVDRGRLARLDLPQQELSIVRQDLVGN